jgi:acyl-CoA thioesterase
MPNGAKSRPVRNNRPIANFSCINNEKIYPKKIKGFFYYPFELKNMSSQECSQKSLEAIRKQFEQDEFAKQFGIVLDTLTESNVQMHMRLRQDMNNLFNRPHGGAIYALADAAFSVIGNNCNNLSVALECSITYNASPNSGETLYVKGEILGNSKRIATFLFRLYTMEEKTEKLIATMQSVLYRTGKTFIENQTNEGKK